jgi:hypothetical protein
MFTNHTEVGMAETLRSPDPDSFSLAAQEDYYHTALVDAPDIHCQASAMVDLGIVHVRTGEYRRGFGEIWNGMRPRPVLHNLGMVAAVAAYFLNPGPDIAAHEYLAGKAPH